MGKPRILFLCHFSNSIIRNVLNLKQYKIQNAIRSLLGIHLFCYDDFAIWVSDYIKEFEKHKDIEFWIVAPHRGLKAEKQTFDVNGIHYFFYKCDYNILYSLLNLKFHLQEKTDYRTNRKRIRNIIESIQPNLIILCGAENPYYSLGVLDIKVIPVYVILQTLLNDPKRIEMGVGTPYRRKSELKIFQHARYFSTSEKKAMDVIKNVNSEVVFLPTGFPTHRPEVSPPKKKDFDFVFFARNVTKNKGIEDLLMALAIVKKSHINATLNVIGGYNDDYKAQIENLIAQLGIQRNVILSGYYDSIDDTFANVVKAKVVVVPGITAGLNSTVREAMSMGLPTICYSTAATDTINKDKICLMTAPIGDVEALAGLMADSLERTDYLEEVAMSGKEYAKMEFGNEAIVNKLLDNCRLIIEKKI